MKSSIALIGFMGAGKSAVAGLLAEKLGKKPVEMDNIIEQRAGKSIADIFNDDGEAAFRRLEIDVTREIAGNHNQVIACGGGIILNNINVERLRKEAVIVYLSASPEAILKRVSNDDVSRPLLSGEDKKGVIIKLLEFRLPLYQKAADIIIDTSALDAEATVKTTIDRLKDYESPD